MPSLPVALIMTLALSAGDAAFAQSVPPASARATIESVSAEGANLTVRTRAGEERTVRLNPKTRLVLVVPATLCDV